ncbi:hypothetical protein F5Y02DRAFT_340400 [Annulohypoxylon stygium]|nr:hypothetical protein F5Y02DRAFT_340400 [Annulohypoxylon stygium]
MSRARPIDAARWEEHRKEISELYECKKLKDVRQIMFEKYGFEASQSQYERQVRKWNLKKTHTGEEWAALSARCRNRIGKGSEFYYRGKLIDTQRAQRVLWRHGYISTIERVTYTQGLVYSFGFYYSNSTPRVFRRAGQRMVLKATIRSIHDIPPR